VKNTQVVILAGGLGKRLRPITEKIPKVMVEVKGKPFLEYLLKMLKKKGFNKFLILAAYLGHMIEDYFGNGEKFGIKIDYSYEKEPMGTGGALKIAEIKLEDQFLLLNGDTYLDMDYNDFLERFKANNKQGQILVYTNDDGSMKNNILIDNNNKIAKYNKKDPAGLNGIDAGVLALKKDILKMIPAKKIVSLENEIYPKMMEADEFYGYPTNHQFLDIGSFKTLQSAEKIIPC
jgi:NDP-sugar pyrophosphorylase family protein